MWYLIPILILSIVVLIAYKLGKELKEDIEKAKYNFGGKDYQKNKIIEEVF